MSEEAEPKTLEYWAEFAGCDSNNIILLSNFSKPVGKQLFKAIEDLGLPKELCYHPDWQSEFDTLYQAVQLEGFDNLKEFIKTNPILKKNVYNFPCEWAKNMIEHLRTTPATAGVSNSNNQPGQETSEQSAEVS